MGIESFPGPNASRIVGEVIDYAGITTPSLWLDCWAQSVLRATYPLLFAAMTQNLGTFTVTIATPGVFTLNAHGLVVGDTVFFTTTGALPTGLVSDFGFVVSSVPTANTFQVTSLGYTYSGITNTLTAGASQDTTGSQSGVHTLWKAPYGVQDSTHFTLPDFRNRKALGIGSPTVGIKAQGAVYGETAHTLLAAEAAQKAVAATGSESATHTHVTSGQYALTTFTAQVAAGASFAAVNNAVTNPTTGTESATHTHAIAGSDAAGGHNTQDPGTITRKIIYAGT